MTVLTTPNLGLPYPDQDENVDVPTDLQALANAIDVLNFVPVGALCMWPGGVAPAGWLLCQGQVVPAASYPGLEQVLGSTGGNVTLPDYRDMFPLGAGPINALGSTGGAAAVTLTGAQSGTNGNGRAANAGTGISIQAGGDHNHGMHSQEAGSAVVGNWPGLPLYADAGHQFDAWKYTDVAGNHGHGVSDPNHGHALTGRNADTSHENRPPFRAINFIIKAG